MILQDVESAEVQGLLRDSIVEMITRLTPPHQLVERAERAASGEVDTNLWDALRGDFGATGLTVPDRLGGAGATFAEAAVVLVELGSSLASVPYVSQVVATDLLLRVGAGAECELMLTDAAAGKCTIAVAFDPESLGEATSADQWTIERSGNDWLLSGARDYVPDLAAADVVLLPIRDGVGVSLFAVRRADLGLALLESLDLTRPLSRVVANRSPAVLLGNRGDMQEAVALARCVGQIAIACEQLGVCRRVLRMAVEYAGSRVQFGRPIGAFQAIKHKLAEVAVSVDSAESAVAHGIWAVERGSSRELEESAAIASIVCGGAAITASAENIQVHGGTGFTWEHCAHLYYRRALADAELYGRRSQHADRLLALAHPG